MTGSSAGKRCAPRATSWITPTGPSTSRSKSALQPDNRDQDKLQSVVVPSGLVDEPEATADNPRRFRTRRARLVAVVAIAFVVALVVSGIVAARSGSSSRANGGQGSAQDFQLPDLRDPSSTVALNDFRGRPVVVNFWA